MKDLGGFVLVVVFFWVFGFLGKVVCYSLSIGILGRFFIIIVFVGIMVLYF